MTSKVMRGNGGKKLSVVAHLWSRALSSSHVMASSLFGYTCEGQNMEKLRIATL